MNKFNVGDDVIYWNEHQGVVREISFHIYDNENIWEYAVEFYDYANMENLWGCSSEDGTHDIVPEGKGKWIVEEQLGSILHA